jgi:hypothetical protein
MRMLEDWGGKNGQFFNYSGSFVSLGTPLEYSGAYVPTGLAVALTPDTLEYSVAYYNIFSRNFNFDPRFTAFSGLPPMTPSVRYLQQEVFKRNFN